MQKDLPDLGSFASVFRPGHTDPGQMLTMEILIAFEDFVFERFNKKIKKETVARECILWDARKNESLESVIKRIRAHNMTDEVKIYEAERIMLQSFINLGPHLWEEFKRNCSIDPFLLVYLDFLEPKKLKP